MKVSVLVPTYNQRHYIQGCLDKILEQKCDSLEILVGDDGSDDGTAEIVKKYGEAFPDKITVFLNKRETEQHKAAGSTNFFNLLHQAKGQYIAICEGDDYWLDPLKLQRQVAFLDNNPEYSACCHDVAVVNEAGEEQYICSQVREISDDKDITVADLVVENPIITVSVMFRNTSYMQDSPEWFFQFRFGDWPMAVQNAIHGPIRYLHQLMAAYRVHSNSTWSSQAYQYRYAAIMDFRFFLNYLLERRYEEILKNKIIDEVVRATADCMHYKEQFERATADCMRYKEQFERVTADYERLVNGNTFGLMGKCCNRLSKALKTLTGQGR